MDLPELFARAGIQPEAVADLMSWARARTSVLLAGLDAKTPLGQSLAPGLAQLVMRQGPESESDVMTVPPAPPLTISEVPAPRGETISRSSPRATARVISRPFLGAAVEAALSSNNLTLEPDEAPPPPTDAAPTELDDEASIGGFARFGVRRPPTSEVVDERLPLSHGFAMHAQREASQFTDVPAPPSFEASESGIRTNLQHISGDSERSTSLVVGIPDDEGADVPIPRSRRISGGLEATASGSLRAVSPERPAQEMTLELNLQIEDPELSSALMAMIPANGETSTMLSASSAASSSLMRMTPVLGEPSLQIPITIDDSMAPNGATGIDDDDETVALHEPEPDLEPTVAIDTTPAKRRPPPPPPAKGVQAGAPAAQPKPASEPTPAASKQKNRGRKKIVELSTPVVRPAARPSAPEPAPARVTREAPRQEHTPIPNYLRDDDE
jgi:hypothetical protein